MVALFYEFYYGETFQPSAHWQKINDILLLCLKKESTAIHDTNTGFHTQMWNLLELSKKDKNK